MAVNEYNVLMRYKDAAGDTTVLYPITKQENITTSGSGAAYTANVASIMELKNGVSFVMIPHTDSTSTSPTLDVNGLGAKRIRRRLSSSTGSTSVGTTDNWLTANKAVRVVYDGSFWIVDFTKPNATDLFGITPIENGGTNASTAEEARANILPPVTSEDEGKNLCVSEDGVWVVGKSSGLATLYVTAPAGVTVTATKESGSETYSVVADSNGLAIFDLTIGTWTISITNELQTQTRTVVIEPDYTASIKFFAAAITVSYPVGSTCTCSNGSYTFNAPDTSGSCTFTVFKTGNWTVRCTDGVDSDSESVHITADGQSTSVTLKYFASYISVTYPEGSTCTCSDGSTTLTASDTSGSYTFTVKNTGTWTIRIVDGDQEASTTVSITADNQNESVTLDYFKAYITITYPEGSTCTCTDGVTTLTASTTTGSWLCKVPNTGTWTVTCTNGTKTNSKSVSITTDGQSESITLSYGTYLYNNGPISGYTWTSDDDLDTPQASVKDNGTYLELYAGSNAWTIFRSDNKINVSSYATLKMKLTNASMTLDSDGIDFGLTSSTNPDNGSTLTTKTNYSSFSGTKELSVDISSVSTSMYVALFVSTPSKGSFSARATEIWFE